MDGDDLDMAWLREQVDQVFDSSSGSRPADPRLADESTADKFALVTALVTILVFLCCLVILAFTAR